MSGKRKGKCRFCKKKYKKRNANQQFCNTDCYQKFLSKKNKMRAGIKIDERGKIGAMSELLVCADLLNSGFEVFRSVSQSCSCDLICMNDDEIYRVEVKTSRITGSGNLQHSQTDESKFNLLALVVGKNIFYKYDDEIIKLEELE